jgi:hypothetical protein
MNRAGREQGLLVVGVFFFLTYLAGSVIDFIDVLVSGMYTAKREKLP